MSDINDFEPGSPTPFGVSSLPVRVMAEAGAASTPSVDMDVDSSFVSTPSKSSKKRPLAKLPVESDDDEQSPVPKKVKGTPAKGSATKGTPKSTPKTGKQGKRKANKNSHTAFPMGQSYELCEDYDRMLVDWKNAGRFWKDINKEWERMTGNRVAASTLPNRFSRLMDNFVVIKEEDNPILIDAKQQVEAQFENNKWKLIGEAMVEKGSGSYKPEVLHRQYKKLMKMAVDLEADEMMPKRERPERNVNDYELHGEGEEDQSELV